MSRNDNDSAAAAKKPLCCNCNHSAAFVARLGAMPDREVAEWANMSVASIQRIRVNHHIPSFRASKKK